MATLSIGGVDAKTYGTVAGMAQNEQRSVSSMALILLKEALSAREVQNVVEPEL